MSKKKLSRRRVLEQALQESLKRAADKPPDNPDQGVNFAVRLALVEKHIEDISQILDRNTHAFIESFKYADMYLHVFQRVVLDLSTGLLVRTDPTLGPAGPDFNWYVHQYIQCAQLADFMGWLSALPLPVYKQEDLPEDAVVFGG